MSGLIIVAGRHPTFEGSAKTTQVHSCLKTNQDMLTTFTADVSV